MDHVLEDLDPVGVVVQQEDPTPGNLLGLHHGLEVRQETHVFGHVSGEDLECKNGDEKF